LKYIPGASISLFILPYVAKVSKELGIRTIFNILGPLANPAKANYELIGVYDENLVESIANVLANLGVKRAMMVHGHDGLDEVTLSTLQQFVK
jgi:anthranilate phosphoribosyltransferase